MTREQAVAAAKECVEFLPGTGVARSEYGAGPNHLRWMVEQMEAGMSENKTMRWLGYIQGILVGSYGIEFVAIKDISRRAVEEDTTNG